MNATPSINLPGELPLWPLGKVPGSSPEDAGLPRLTYYLPSEEYRTGQTVLICPGGGYNMVSTPKEGRRPAQLLAANGIAAAVLEYRHSPSRYPVPLLDAQRAIRVLRAKAAEQGLNPARIGIMGFSAGGHLAGMAATQAARPEALAGDEVDRHSCAPDLLILIYPVVSLTAPFSHFGSRDSLLGPGHDPALAEQLSIEKAVGPSCPPVFIAHGQADGCVPPANAWELYAALTAHGVRSTMHLYERDEHGFGLGSNHVWGRDLLEWLELHR